MYRADEFVFIHMFRMGGTTCIGQINATNIGYHLPYSMLPEQLSYLPVVGVVRNPYDWYVSVYQHCKNTSPDMQTATFLNFILDFKHTDMEDALTKLIDPSWMTEEDKENALKHFPTFYDYDNIKLDNLRKTEFLSYLEGDTGFLTWLFGYMYAINGYIDGVKLCRLESLSTDWKQHTGKNIVENNLNSFEDAPGCGNSLSPTLKALIKSKDKHYFETYYRELL